MAKSTASGQIPTSRKRREKWGTRQGGPDLLLMGSSTLTSVVLEHGLADEVVLLVDPVLLGVGKRLFADGTPARAFELASTTATPTGIVVNSYKPAGPLKNQ